MGALNDLKEQGKIRAIGVSNFSRTQLAEACEYGEIDSLQPPYSLFWRHVGQDAMPFCSESDWAKMDKIGRTVTDYLDENPVMWNF